MCIMELKVYNISKSRCITEAIENNRTKEGVQQNERYITTKNLACMHNRTKRLA